MDWLCCLQACRCDARRIPTQCKAVAQKMGVSVSVLIAILLCILTILGKIFFWLSPLNLSFVLSLILSLKQKKTNTANNAFCLILCVLCCCCWSVHATSTSGLSVLGGGILLLLRFLRVLPHSNRGSEDGVSNCTDCKAHRAFLDVILGHTNKMELVLNTSYVCNQGKEANCNHGNKRVTC